jgi:hypothetical protein
MTDDKTPVPKPPKGRSPSYPSIPLKDAIARARTIWDFSKQHPLPVATITSKWGYKSPTTGPASTTYAALKKYGLLTDEGNGSDRRGKLTDLAVAILNKPDPSDDMRQAALTPPIMREFWSSYGREVPPQDSLHWDYVVQKGFTETGLAEFLRVYKANLATIGADSSATVDDEAERNGDPDEDDEQDDERRRIEAETRRREQESNRRRTGVLTVPVLLQDSDPVVVEFPGKLSEDDWEYFLEQLTAMKRGVVQKSSSPAPED